MEKVEKASISLHPSLWRAFRAGCVQRKTSASKKIEQFIKRQLDTWHTETQKDTKHD